MIGRGEKESKGEVVLGHAGSGYPESRPGFQLDRMVMLLGKSADRFKEIDSLSKKPDLKSKEP